MPSFSSTTPQPPLRIATLVYPGCMGMHVFGITEVLRMGCSIGRRLHPHRPTPLSTQWISARGGPVHIAGGVPIATNRGNASIDLLIVPGMELAQQPADWDMQLAGLVPEVTYIRKMFAKGTGLASVCIGAFLLAQAQVLAGRRATTSWLFAADLAQRVPLARVETQSMIVDDSGVITSGAVSAGFDLAIYLLKRTWGADVATATARIASLADVRSSQLPFVDAQLLSPVVSHFSKQVMDWLEQRLAEPFDLQRLADAFFVSSSTLLRRVKAETGKTPLTLLQSARIQHARKLLETSRASLDQVIQAVGYSDPSSFTRLFVRMVGESPARYRQRHRVII